MPSADVGRRKSLSHIGREGTFTFPKYFFCLYYEIVGFLCLRASFTFFGASTEIVEVLLFLSLPCDSLTMTELYQVSSGTFNTYIPDSSLELLR